MKKRFRQQLRKVLADIPHEQASQQSTRACQLLIEQPEYKKAEIMMVFLSRPGEFDTTSLVLRAWQDRKRVLAPRVSWEQRRMLPIEIRSLTHDLTLTGMGLREPATGTLIPVSLIDLVVVPGLGFDAKGNRLGRGRGFYDRFLGNPEFHGVACALAFEQQLVPELPAGPLDRPVDLLITDVEVRRFK
ncbi:MAG TPA: 5-formyltetrahydrofolate cyclo-ligase [Phycisphaerae bacterium]|nr:5-formyltetrahydrofolate cyclo-ligase [Phycisphaerae bacterium]